MSTISNVNKGKPVDRAKKVHICKATKKRIEISDKHAFVPKCNFLHYLKRKITL
jgi:hypothetical protein